MSSQQDSQNNGGRVAGFARLASQQAEARNEAKNEAGSEARKPAAVARSSFMNQPVKAVRHLILIESPGKIDTLKAALKRSRLDDFHIIATSGHLYELPESLDDVGIDHNLVETGRKPRKPNGESMIAHISKWAAVADRVLIACDADQEGDVLAWDLAQIAEDAGQQSISRVRLRSLDTEGVIYAFLHPEPVRARDAWAGTTRRMLDRLIGTAYSIREDYGALLSVGRVQSGMLGVAATQGVSMGEAQIVLPSRDGRDPFVATIAIRPDNINEVRELVELSKEFMARGDTVAIGHGEPIDPPAPWTYGDAVAGVAKATDCSLEAASQSLQRLYEAGRLSYPRSAASAVTAQGLATLQRIATDHGVRFDAERVAVFSRQGRHAHESPRPMTEKVDMSSPLLVLTKDEAALALLTRQLMSCGQPHAMYYPEPSQLPKWAAGLNFERKVCQWLRPWPKKAMEPGIRLFSKEEMALQMMLANQLGRPSTLVFHAMKFATRALLDEQGQLSAKGKDWLRQTPALLRDPRTSAQIERVIDSCVEDGPGAVPPSRLVREILESLKVWDRVQERLDAQGSGLVASGSAGGAGRLVG